MTTEARRKSHNVGAGWSRGQQEVWQRGLCTHVVHHLLEALAEGAPSNACKALLSLREGDGPNGWCHPKLLHHGVGNASDLPQVILRSWSIVSRKGFFDGGAEFRAPWGPHWHTAEPDSECLVPMG